MTTGAPHLIDVIDNFPALKIVVEHITTILDKLEGFISRFGAEFYGQQPNKGHVILKREAWTPPKIYGGIPVFRGGEKLAWRLKNG